MKKQFPLKQVMDQYGNLIDPSFEQKINNDLVDKFYYHMLRIRTFDRKAISLQRQGRIGTYPPFEGQEAAQVGSALALEENDWMFPTYRDHGATLTFGADMTRCLLMWNGRMEGGVPPERKNIFPAAIPIATQIPHAAGCAWAEKKKGTKNVVIAYFGDGATSEGDFHEGLNFASVFQVPAIFFNQNNGYAISVPLKRQMNSETIAQKAVAYDMRSMRVDGNDCFSVYFATKEAADLARAGEGPTFIEAVTWRKGAHTTADDPTKYRADYEGKDIVDPLERLEKFMKNYGYWDDEKVKAWQQEVEEEVETAVEQMEQYPEPAIDDLFNYVFTNTPDQLVAQRDEYLKFVRG